VLDGGESLGNRRELRFLQFHERRHLTARVAVRQIEHAVVETVESGQGDELELVAHRAQLALEASDRCIVEVLFPVERRRAVVRQHLVREPGVDRIGKRLGEVEIGLAGFAPKQIGIGSVSESARHRLVETVARLVKTLDCALAGTERLVVVVDVGRDEIRGLRRRCAPESVSARPMQSAASLAATSFSTASRVGTSTLPPICPHFFTEAS
jgi:hypothetical protein